MPATTQRVLSLLSLLQAGSVWTGPELADRLAVSTRCVRRDVERLRELGYPVHSTHGVGGGYRLGAGRALPPLLLEDEEAVAVAVSLRLAAGGTVAGASDAALRTLAKLDTVTPPRLRAEIRAITEATSTLMGDATEVDGEALLRLARACRDRVRVRFRYEGRVSTDQGGGPARASDRDVEPYGLVATGRRWYLMAWDVDRSDWRTFRLDRMREVKASTFRFAAREHPEPARYVQRSVVSSPYRYQARVRMYADAHTVRARVSASSAAVEAETDATCILTAGGDHLEGIALHIGSVGHDMEVLDPPELAEAMATLGARFCAAAIVHEEPVGSGQPCGKRSPAGSDGSAH